MSLHLRSGIYYLKKRVPKAYASVEPRRDIWVSLRTDSLRAAEEKYVKVWDGILAAWKARLKGDTTDADKRYAAAIALAAAHNVNYINVGQVAELELAGLRERLDLVFKKGGLKPDKALASALMGGVQAPSITLSAALKFHLAFEEGEMKLKSADQLRKWRNPLIKAVKNFILVVGDKELHRLTADDMLDFRSWWLDRINDEDLSPATANKDLIHLGTVVNSTIERKKLGFTAPMSGYKFKFVEQRIRKAFTDDWIKNKILRPGALDGLNPEARAIVLGMINTGYRPSEGAALLSSRMHLTSNTPYIEIKPDGREVKSRNALRYIPLTGVSLEALRQFPEGFPRYRNNSNLSAAVNKYFRENGLLESDEHSFYSLRHSFQDRMVRAGFDPRLQADFMGHAFQRERYGDGGGLDFKFAEMSRIAL